MLNNYLKDTQLFLRDVRQDMLNPQFMIRWINRARREVAMRSQCIRILTPISGQIVSATVTAPGTGYTSPTVVVSAPDFPSSTLPFPSGSQATASATMLGGAITAVNMTYGGYGYFQPKMTITDPTGVGATVTPVMSFINQLNQGQEVYPFSAVDLSPFPGVSAIHMIKSASIIYSNYRYSLPCYSFSTYQAMIRQYPFQYQWTPTFCAQYGQGTNGSFYMYPLPSQAYQLEWDCFCIPQDLTDDLSVEAIPQPWQDAVAYFASHLCYLELQNFNFATGYLKMFDDMMHRYRSYATPGRVTNPYGRWIFPLLIAAEEIFRQLGGVFLT